MADVLTGDAMLIESFSQVRNVRCVCLALIESDPVLPGYMEYEACACVQRLSMFHSE